MYNYQPMGSRSRWSLINPGRGRANSVSSGVDTRQSSPHGRPAREKRKSTIQPKSSLKQQNPQLFPPPRPIIRTLEGEQLDAIDAQQTAAKEVKRRWSTMEEIRRLEKEFVEAKENACNNLRWHNLVRANKRRSSNWKGRWKELLIIQHCGPPGQVN